MSGVDLSESAIRLCKKRGLEASQTDFLSASLDGRRFDVITMSELIEHVPSPARFLRRAAQLLEREGVLYVTTPNFGSLAQRTLKGGWSIIHREHIGYFERSTLRRMACDGTGLREIKIEAKNIAPSTLVAWVQGRKEGSPTNVADMHREMRKDVDQRLRRTILARPALNTSKKILNRLISRIGLGDTLVAWLQKRDA